MTFLYIVTESVSKLDSILKYELFEFYLTNQLTQDFLTLVTLRCVNFKHKIF